MMMLLSCVRQLQQLRCQSPSNLKYPPNHNHHNRHYFFQSQIKNQVFHELSPLLPSPLLLLPLLPLSLAPLMMHLLPLLNLLLCAPQISPQHWRQLCVVRGEFFECKSTALPRTMLAGANKSIALKPHS
jgi:hypothetical protein